MAKLQKLKPRVRLLNDFYVADTETGIDVPYSCLATREEKIGIKWLLRARPENFKLGVIYGKNYTKVFTSREEMVQEFLTERFKNKKVFMHNIGNFDGSVLFGNLCVHFPEAIFNGSRFISASNGVCTFADSVNIFVGQSIEKIGKQLGIEKPDLGNDYWSENGITHEEINRCIQDCIILYDALCLSFEFAGDIKITQASLSMTYFRRHHQPYDIEHNPNTAYFWDSYFGGRTEAFFIGKTNAVVYDVKSMYPDQMKNLKFPNPKNLKFIDDVQANTFIKRYLYDYEGCVYAKIRHKPLWFGLLPVKHNGKLLFPTGNFSGCWNFNEFRYAYETGYIEIKSISKVVYSESMPSPFVGFVDQLFLLKAKAELEGNDFWRDLYKRYVNSLYGKFAQKIDEESIYIENIERQYQQIYDAQKSGLFKKLILFNSERLDAFLITGTNKKIAINHSIPSFASYITSGARAKIAKKLMDCKINKVVYCDTDSIFVENEIGLIEENFLGGWGREDKIVTEIRGLKNYKFLKGGKAYRRLKGVPDKAKEIETDNFKYANLIKTKEALRRNLEAGILTQRKKVIKNKYDKRIVLADGNTLPINFK